MNLQLTRTTKRVSPYPLTLLVICFTATLTFGFDNEKTRNKAERALR